MRGLYAIIDVDTLQRRGLDVVRFADAVLSAKPAAIQLRDKRQDARATLALLRAIGPLARRRQVPLFANDRADLAALAGCDGLHVGQTDLPPALARRVAGSLGARPQIGLSIHNLQQLHAARDEPLDYLAFGPVFETRSKANPDPTLGLDGLAQLTQAAAERGLPCVGIGGIGLHNAAAVARTCPCAAVIGALLPDDSIAGDSATMDRAPDDSATIDSSPTDSATDGWEPAVSERASQLHALLCGDRPSPVPGAGESP